MHVIYRNGRSIQKTVQFDYKMVLCKIGRPSNFQVAGSCGKLIYVDPLTGKCLKEENEQFFKRRAKSIRCVSTIWETISYEPPPMIRIIWFLWITEYKLRHIIKETSIFDNFKYHMGERHMIWVYHSEKKKNTRRQRPNSFVTGFRF